MHYSLPRPANSGCSSKLRASDLLGLMPAKIGIEALAIDSGETSGKTGHRMSIDCITPVVRDGSVFGRIAVNHALNDLYASGVSPSDSSVCFAFKSASIENGSAIAVCNGVILGLESSEVALTNAHTIIAEEDSVTVASLGMSLTRPQAIDSSVSYGILLTKPIGASLCYYLGSLLDRHAVIAESQGSMLVGHKGVESLVSNMCVKPTTDISGFGLGGHLAIMSRTFSFGIDINTDKIPLIEGMSSLSEAILPDCSARRNLKDFENFFSIPKTTRDLDLIAIFNAETSGPIALVAPESNCQELLQELLGLGFKDARLIGSAKITKEPYLHFN